MTVDHGETEYVNIDPRKLRSFDADGKPVLHVEALNAAAKDTEDAMAVYIQRGEESCLAHLGRLRKDRLVVMVAADILFRHRA